MFVYAHQHVVVWIAVAKVRLRIIIAPAPLQPAQTLSWMTAGVHAFSYSTPVQALTQTFLVDVIVKCRVYLANREYNVCKGVCKYV